MLRPTRVGDRAHPLSIVTSKRRSCDGKHGSRMSTRLRYPSVRMHQCVCPLRFPIPIVMLRPSQPRSGAGGPLRLPQCPRARRARSNTRSTRMDHYRCVLYRVYALRLAILTWTLIGATRENGSWKRTSPVSIVLSPTHEVVALVLYPDV